MPASSIAHFWLSVMLSEEYESPGYEEARTKAWAELSRSEREQLHQLLQGPVWDGDVISKTCRDTLIDLGLAVRCCMHGEQGYTVGTYRGWYVQDGMPRDWT